MLGGIHGEMNCMWSIVDCTSIDGFPFRKRNRA